MDPWKRRFLLETIISRFHVELQGCSWLNHGSFEEATGFYGILFCCLCLPKGTLMHQKKFPLKKTGESLNASLPTKKNHLVSSEEQVEVYPSFEASNRWDLKFKLTQTRHSSQTAYIESLPSLKLTSPPWRYSVIPKRKVVSPSTMFQGPQLAVIFLGSVKLDV